MTRHARVLALVIISAISTIAHADASPETVAGATTIDSATAKQMFDDGALFIDVRKQLDWDAGRVPDALHLDVKSAFTKDAVLAEAATDAPIVIYCNGHSCTRSSKASQLAVSWGFKNIRYYRDGFPAWKKAGYPVE